MTDSPKPKITIRPRRPSDLPSLPAILHSVYAKFQYPVEMPELKTDAQIIDFITPANAWQIWVAEAILPSAIPEPTSSSSSSSTFTSTPPAPRIIGHVALTPFHRNARESTWAAAGCTPENSGHLGRLFVDPQAQGLGAGTALMKTAMEWAVVQGKRLCIYVVTKDVVATALYERLGWTRIGMETYQGWDNWMYVWHGWGKAEGGEGDGEEQEAKIIGRNSRFAATG